MAAAPFSIPTSSAQGFQFLHTLTKPSRFLSFLMVAIMGHRGVSCASVLSHPTPNSNHWLLSPHGSPGRGIHRYWEQSSSAQGLGRCEDWGESGRACGFFLGCRKSSIIGCGEGCSQLCTFQWVCCMVCESHPSKTVLKHHQLGRQDLLRTALRASACEPA